MKRPTMALRGGAAHSNKSAAVGTPIVTPITQSVNFVLGLGAGQEVLYPRYGNTPNVSVVEQRLAMLDGAESAVVLASGMGATACAMLALLRPGDHLLTSSWIYGGTHKLFTTELTAMGINVTTIDPLAPRQWRRARRDNTRAIFVESPVNPTCRVLDLSFLAITTCWPVSSSAPLLI
jgi:methionine-gamma-lyase